MIQILQRKEKLLNRVWFSQDIVMQHQLLCVAVTVLGSVGSAVNKTDTVTALMQFRVSQEDMHLTNKYQSLMKQAQRCDVLQRGGSK